MPVAYGRLLDLEKLHLLARLISFLAVLVHLQEQGSRNQGDYDADRQEGVGDEEETEQTAQDQEMLRQPRLGAHQHLLPLVVLHNDQNRIDDDCHSGQIEGVQTCSCEEGALECDSQSPYSLVDDQEGEGLTEDDSVEDDSKDVEDAIERQDGRLVEEGANDGRKPCKNKPEPKIVHEEFPEGLELVIFAAVLLLLDSYRLGAGLGHQAVGQAEQQQEEQTGHQVHRCQVHVLEVEVVARGHLVV